MILAALWVALPLVHPAVDLEDPRWESGADALLDGPSGCWEVVGRATWSHDLGRWGSTEGDAVFVGRLEAGVWSRWKVFPLGEVEVHGTERAEIFGTAQRVTPLVGRVRGLAVGLDRTRRVRIARSRDPRIAPVNTARDVIERLGADESVAWWATAEAEGVVLHRRMQVGRQDAPLRVEATYPWGGSRPTRWTMTLQGTHVHEGWIPARVTALEATLLGREEAGQILPRWESLHMSLTMSPLVRVAARQTVDYRRILPCTSEEP